MLKIGQNWGKIANYPPPMLNKDRNPWMKPTEEFACFDWMTMNDIPSWNDVEPCLKYLIGKGVDVDDAKCFDQICNL